MRDALGRIDSLLVVGATSEIGQATARSFVARGCRRVVLAARDVAALDGHVKALTELGAAEVAAVEFEATAVESHEAVVDSWFEAYGDFDVVVLAFGVLGDQAECELQPGSAAEILAVNYVGAVTTGLALAARLRSQGHGELVVLSSVAAERPRRSNFVYGSSKAGLDAFAQGLGDALIGTGARVVVVRPGFVHTRMTAGLPPQPFSTTPDVVAEAIVDGVASGAEIVWVPSLLRWVFVVMRHLPRSLWRIVSRRG